MHELKLYSRALSGHRFPYVIIPGGMSLLGTIAGLIALIPPAAPGALPVLLISALILIINIILYKTSVSRKMEQWHIELYDYYNGLPEQLRQQVVLTPSIIKDMSLSDTKKTRGKLIQLECDYQALQEERNRYSGPVYMLKQKIETVHNDVKADLDAVRTVNKDMKELY